MAEQRKPFRLHISVSIEQDGGYSGRLQVNEQVQVSAASFLEVATILSRFHELAEQLQNQEKGTDVP